MPILNYSTEISSEQTGGEIITLLIRKQARSVTTDFNPDGDLQSISFVIAVAGLPVRFNLPANVEGVAKVLLQEEPWSNRRSIGRLPYEAKVRKRASWVAWRILKDWVAAQMALIESGQAEVGQVFMPYATQANGRTMYELFIENNQRQLGSVGA